MNQQEHDNTELYRALRCKFEMTPEQMQRLEKNIRQRAAEKPYSRMITVRRCAKRVIPLAACIALIFAAGYRLRNQLPQPEYTQTSNAEVQVAEQTLPAEESAPAETSADTSETSGKPVQTVTGTAKPQHDAAGTALTQTTAQQTAADTQTAAATETVPPDTTSRQTETESPVTGTAPEQTHTETTAASTAATATAATTATTAATTVTTAETHSETTEEPLETDAPIPAHMKIVMPDVTAAAGEQITVTARLNEDAAVAGLQFYVQLITDSETEILPQISEIRSEISYRTRSDSTFLNHGDDWAIVVFGSTHDLMLPAGTEILTMQITVPEDAPSGTVYRFSPEHEKIRFVDSFGNSLPLSIEYGSITVA